jgi:uncharacterized protein
MSPVTQRAIELFLEKRVPSLELLKFSWFGGEPLLATDVVLRLSEFAKDLCDRHSIKFQGGMTTNGYVLEKPLAEKLISLNQDFFQVTFDGWGTAHDELRKRADGRETFQKIWDNLIAMKSLKPSGVTTGFILISSIFETWVARAERQLLTVFLTRNCLE